MPMRGRSPASQRATNRRPTYRASRPAGVRARLQFAQSMPGTNRRSGAAASRRLLLRAQGRSYLDSWLYASRQYAPLCRKFEDVMHGDPLLQILILLFASVCVVAGVRKLRLPAILGYLAVGMLLGPHAFALAQGGETTQLLADFGVVFLVFTLGLEFSLPRLVAMRWEVLGVGGAQVLITSGIVAAALTLLFNVVPAVAVVIGGAVAMSSTAIIISQLTEQSENNRTHGRLAVAICLFQDLSFPLFLALIPRWPAEPVPPPNRSWLPSAAPSLRCCWCWPPDVGCCGRCSFS